MRLIAIVAASAALYAQAPAADVAYDLTTPAGIISGSLRMPAEQQFSSRPGAQSHAVLVLGGSNVAANTYAMLADFLAVRGIATLRTNKPGVSVDEASLWIEKLRNDNRFKSVIVAAYGDGSLAGVMAARETRADGFVSIAGDNSSSEFGRLKRPTKVIADVAAAPSAIADYVNGLLLPPHAHGERKSPRTVTSTVIDGTRIAVEYGQLGVRNRQIWGGIVPWNRHWMPGADEATTLTTSGQIVLGGLTVPAGDHTLFAMPSEDNFLLLVSNETYQFHTDYHEARDLGRVKMSMAKLEQPAELLRFEIVKTATGGTLKFAWADREYAVPFTVR